MREIFHTTIAKYVMATSFLLVSYAECPAYERTFVVAAKQAKCSAPTVMDYEGTDMSGVTRACNAIFEACIDESLPCNVRKQKCAQFDKMDGDGSCYKKKR